MGFLFYAGEGGEALCADFLDGGHIISAAHPGLISHISSLISFALQLFHHNVPYPVIMAQSAFCHGIIVVYEEEVAHGSVFGLEGREGEGGSGAGVLLDDGDTGFVGGGHFGGDEDGGGG